MLKTKSFYLIITIVILFFSVGCGIQDQSDYVLANLNASCKDDVSEFAKITKDTPESLHEEYTLVMKSLTYALTIGIDFTDAELETISNAVKSLYMAGDYSVGKAQKDADGLVSVPVDILPVTNLSKIYSKLNEELTAYFSNTEFSEINGEDLESIIKARMIEVIKNNSSPVEYGEKVSLSVTFSKDLDKKYTVNEEELSAVKEAIVSLK